MAWMRALADCCQEVIALEGKTMRRSLDRADGTGPMHVVSAGASRHALVLAPGKVDANSNESPALPELLSLRNLEGKVGTIDAMGCQVEVARQSIDQGGDYVLSVKENQPSVYGESAELFAWRTGPHAIDEEVVCGSDEQGDGGHGRGETRKGGCPHALEGVVSCERWPG